MELRHASTRLSMLYVAKVGLKQREQSFFSWTLKDGSGNLCYEAYE